jgi:hypothetical protein
MRLVAFLISLSLSSVLLFQETVAASDRSGPEEVVRALVRANAQKDLVTMARLMAHDSDMISYTIGGRKYVGWAEFAQDMQHEFDSVDRLEIPITDLKIWTRDDTAWFAMELDYIRYGPGGSQERTVLPLRETGVLERRHGRWILVAWHESPRSVGDPRIRIADSAPPPLNHPPPVNDLPQDGQKPNLSGEWSIQEEDKSYQAVLDQHGNGTYSWQSGRITTTNFSNRRWQGSWHQPGNDREGGFEVLLSEDGAEARGVWWYTRVGDRTNIPPRQWGGAYVWKRVIPSPDSAASP